MKREREYYLENLLKGGDFVSKYESARQGDPIGDSMLTAQGAAELNSYRGAVASGLRPTLTEIASAVLANILRNKGQRIPEGSMHGVLRMEREDLQIYPGRRPWSLDSVNEWLAGRAKKGS